MSTAANDRPELLLQPLLHRLSVAGVIEQMRVRVQRRRDVRVAELARYVGHIDTLGDQQRGADATEIMEMRRVFQSRSRRVEQLCDVRSRFRGPCRASTDSNVADQPRVAQP